MKETLKHICSGVSFLLFCDFIKRSAERKRKRRTLYPDASAFQQIAKQWESSAKQQERTKNKQRKDMAVALWS